MALLLAALAFLQANAAQPDVETARLVEQPHAFAVPRMPLRAALEQYHVITGLSLLYDDAIAHGHMAGPLQGTYAARDALRLLLAGTGLQVQYTSPRAFMLIAPRSSSSSQAGRRRDGGALVATRTRVYYARVQSSVLAALCHDPHTRPGPYRLAMNVWVNEGRIAGLALHETGDARRDARIRSGLLGLPVPGLPPADVTQPITLLVLPRPPAHTGDCETGGLPPKGPA